MGCLIQVCTDFTPVKWPWKGMKTGYVYVKTAEFKDQAGAAINITSDGFSIQIKNSAGIVVETLTTPAGGLTISGTNKLNIKVGLATTATAGVYTGFLVWTRVSTGAIIPIAELTFSVT